ncbi:hypothetical protein CAEBREN_11362 [Caenorhabditis brenneri]|uniref:Elongator complex protein 5 n=1 Tax=Caenorhabditis brenneri TaxID=135651 RepID=G0N4V9_CAEBE|nr:hypothetical protein CAEBREN_11362 [Caenorhabditis brenneri]
MSTFYDLPRSSVTVFKAKRRIFIVAPSDFPPPLHLEHMTNATFAIKKTDNAEVFECSTTTFDKKGNITISDQLITIPSAGTKPIFKTVKKVENPSETSVSIGVSSDQNTGKASMDLPFFVGRQEDGVAIRDAATKKIRVGGQIVYEPDKDDDLDDSDPDDDLNI